MRKYEIMFVLPPDIGQQERESTFVKLQDTLKKFKTKIVKASIWAEKKKIFFDLVIKGKPTKYREGLFYLIELEADPLEIKKIDSAYKLNEGLLRFLITAVDSK